LEKLDPLFREVGSQHDAREVPTGPRQTSRQPEVDRIGPRDEHDDRDRLRHVACGADRGGATRDDAALTASHELGPEPREPSRPTVVVAPLDLPIATLHIAEFTENLDEIATCVIRRG